MPSLAETQELIRAAVVAGDPAGIIPLLYGGRDPAKRLAIHQRNYEASMVAALATKFPALAWLIGTPFFTATARMFVHLHPPTAPSIAEYGANFPAFLAARPGAERMPYVRSFGMLEWHLGQVAVAGTSPALTVDTLARIDAERVAESILRTQPGLRYIEAAWPVDELMKTFLSDAAPDRYEFDPEDVWLEINGGRGAFAITRLDVATFIFRRTISQGRSIGGAAEQALAANPSFDPGCALAAFVSQGLATAVIEPCLGGQP